MNKFFNFYITLQTKYYFNSKYYLSQYDNCTEDIKKNPYYHFMNIGWKENKNPSKMFDVHFYLNTYKDVKASNINPLLHYVIHGRKENRKRFLNDKKLLSKGSLTLNIFFNIFKFVKNNPYALLKIFYIIKHSGFTGLYKKILNKFGKIEEAIPEAKNQITIETFLNDNFLSVENNSIIPNTEVVDILIPVYNGFEYLETLFTSIIKNTSSPYRIFIANDKSSDLRVLPFLEKIKQENSNIPIIIFNNQNNLGFVKTINLLVSNTNNHCVLLNTDVEVPKYWLERLMYPIFNLPKIASTTPFTNSGTICSFPNYLKDNTIYDSISLEQIDNVFSTVNGNNTYIEIPTGVGFCMGINKYVIKKIGMFDEVYGKGYGEENDWCQRAIKLGYKNIHVTNLFVYHKHGGSFLSEEKKELIQKNSNILSKKFPTYNQQVRSLIEKNQLELLRQIINIKILSLTYPIVCILDHSLGGGANIVTQEYITTQKLSCVLTYNIHLQKYKLIFYENFSSNKIECNIHNIENLEKIITKFNFKEIRINNLVSFPKILFLLDLLIEIKVRLKIKYTFLINDYYAICPIYVLLNENLEFCNVPSNFNVCNNCLSKNKLKNNIVDYINSDYPNLKINIWRDKFNLFLNNCNQIITFSNSSKEIVLKAYPKLIQNKIDIKPHQVTWINQQVNQTYKHTEVLNIGVLGNLTLIKGEVEVMKLASYIESHQSNIKIHILGNINFNKSILNTLTCIEVHGEYIKENLPELMIKNKIDLIWIASICSETFSYTTEESIQMNIPLAVFNIGAPAERIKKYAKGILLENKKPEQILQQIFNYFNIKPNILAKNIQTKDIRFICVSNNEILYKQCIEANFFVSQYPILKFNNLLDNVPIPKRYNSAIDQVLKDNFHGWLFFIHNDFVFLENPESILKSLNKNHIYGPIGAKLINGKKKILGQINQKHNETFMKHGIEIIEPTLVDTVDCQCLFIHSDLIRKYNLKFDENSLFDFHQYAECFCLDALYKYNIKTYAVQINCQHLSWGKLTKSYYNAEAYLKKKYNKKEWAGTCTHLK